MLKLSIQLNDMVITQTLSQLLVLFCAKHNIPELSKQGVRHGAVAKLSQACKTQHDLKHIRF